MSRPRMTQALKPLELKDWGAGTGKIEKDQKVAFFCTKELDCDNHR